MKKMALFLCFLLAVSHAWAGGPYFCSKPGCSLYYERYEEGTGKFLRTTLLDFVSVRREGNGKVVEYGMTLGRPNGRELYGGRAAMTTVIAGNGDVWMDLGASVRMILQNLFPRAEIVSTGTPAILPAGMSPGDTLPEARCVVTVAGFAYSVVQKHRKVLRTERIETPAGVFDCVVEQAYKEEEGPMYARNTWAVTWYAEGIGYVRHDTYDRKMNLLSSEVLVRIDTH